MTFFEMLVTSRLAYMHRSLSDKLGDLWRTSIMYLYETFPSVVVIVELLLELIEDELNGHGE